MRPPAPRRCVSFAIADAARKEGAEIVLSSFRGVREPAASLTAEVGVADFRI